MILFILLQMKAHFKYLPGALDTLKIVRKAPANMMKYHGFINFVVQHPQSTYPFAEVRLFAKNETLSELRDVVRIVVFIKEDHPLFIKSFKIYLDK